MSILVHQAGEACLELSVEENSTLAGTIWLSGAVRPPALCSGLGCCGKCRVRFISAPPESCAAEKMTLTAEELAQNVRLACRHQACPGMEVQLLAPAGEQWRHIGSHSGQKLLLAIDLGTTSLHWCALDEKGVKVAEGQELNPQMGAGSELMSRLAAAGTEQGKKRLAGLVRKSLHSVIDALPETPAQCCLVANPAMTAIFLEKNIEGLVAAPYRLDDHGSRFEKVPGLPRLWLPPQTAPFVGADATACIAHVLARENAAYPFLLVDLGTNGEFVLALEPHKSLVASVPLGPALEGIGLRHGSLAEKGAASAFTLGPQGLRPVVYGGGQARSICASGYISLVSVLLRCGLLDPEGHFRTEARHMPGLRLAEDISRREGAPCLDLDQGLWLGARDVEAILAVKAAFSLTLARLFASAGLHARDLRHIFLAGALGSHVDTYDFETLGFFPSGVQKIMRGIGNAALEGAQLFLLDAEARSHAALWAQGCRALELAETAGFHEAYMGHMIFAWATSEKP